MSDTVSEKSCLPFGSLAVQEVAEPQFGYLPSRSQTKSRVRLLLALVGLVALVFAVYWPALSARFIYLDDTKHILQNSVVTGGITSQGLIAAFRPYASIWTPLTWISHMVVVEFAGLNPEWHHFVNVVL